MEHQDHVALLRDGVDGGGVWADLGSGGGAFTLALADLLGPGSTIYSVDRDGRGLRRQREAMQASFPDVAVHYIEADYTGRLDLPPLDGVVMANALHFQRKRRKGEVLDLIHGYLKPGGRLVIVEYNTDRGNLWVPHAFSYDTWTQLASAHGFSDTRQLATRPSRHLREIYSAITFKGGEQ
ncbi:MAG TPA: class I SAM-dependent methyltransferase [Thermomicrobiales bacterium]|nr:class I SAM-dependent methyltransferase [Thermomicrobiales bacterium]